MVLLCSFHWILLPLFEYFCGRKEWCELLYTFFACFFDCLCYCLALFSFCFYSGPFFFVICFILWYICFWKTVGLDLVICHPRVLLQQLKRSVNFETSWLQAGFKQAKQNAWAVLAGLVYSNWTGKNQMWFQGPDEVQMKVVLLPIVGKTLRNAQCWSLLAINNVHREHSLSSAHLCVGSGRRI